MRPERRVLVQSGPASVDLWYNRSVRINYDDYWLFFSVGPTLGLVHEPVFVSVYPKLVGWLGGNRVIFQEDYMKRFCLCEMQVDRNCTSEVEIRGTKGCCNQRWAVLAGIRESTNESGLFVCKVNNTQLDPCWHVMQCSCEFDFESDVVEAIFIEERGAGEFLVVVHINLNFLLAQNAESCTAAAPLSVIVCECNISKVGCRAAWHPQPLVDRSSGMYYLMLGYRYVLVLNTGEIFSLMCRDFSLLQDVRAVDETHLSLTTGISTTASTSVYSLPDLISSSTPSSLPPRPETSSCFDKVTPCHVHRSSPGAVFLVGCGIVAASNSPNSMSSTAPLCQSPPAPKRPRLNSTVCGQCQQPGATEEEESCTPPQGQMWTHEFIDATTGTLLFKVTQAGSKEPLLPVDVQPVPLRHPF
ncbi:hypothetical protein Pelo_17137 [Pelomyxa schiedti]|nr:hypothetical protein Pelo_17137 [Pelomyxa schiedti]